MESTTAELPSICPHFIVKEYRASVDHYRDKRGFAAIIQAPKENPYFAVVRRSGVTVALKEIASDVPPMPNRGRHEYARWDAFVDTRDPDALYEEYCVKGVTIHKPLADIEEELRAFEIQELNGYVICFGRPLDRGRGH